jgi:diadenosine tetraphosphate (Ap4A) HIT family hydrolase
VNEKPTRFAFGPGTVREAPMTPTAKPCPFCNPSPQRVAHEGVAAMALWDSYPLSPGHMLIVPRRHVASLFDTTAAAPARFL